MVENSGQVRYSPVKAVRFDREFWVSVYPNPFKEAFNVKIYNPERKNITLSLFDNLGRMHLKVQLEGEEIHYQPTERLDYLAAGTYLLQISTGSQIEIVKLVKN
ncbi:MAG: T9SS type A sorting domain-containing protein [Bacteroidia bacterium]|nr:T9SS type A sorting domain-containing protein [Bacteroidia bacterium]